MRRERLVGAGDVVAQVGGIRIDAAQLAVPGVAVRVDEAGDDDAAARVDDFRVAGLDMPGDAGNGAVAYQDVALRQVRLLRVHRQDGAALEQQGPGPLGSHPARHAGSGRGDGGQGGWTCRQCGGGGNGMGQELAAVRLHGVFPLLCVALRVMQEITLVAMAMRR